ncbi:MAG: DUF5667 domain-containing protein [Dehalococcoidales bacterium]|nr:DUF5667 domain-containing protein [Dehalococcoidales bacterium]
MFKKKANNLDRILDDCLDRILIGGESTEKCLADYPECRDELKSLLDISIKTQKAMSSIEACPDFKARLRYELNSKANYANAPKRASFRWQGQWAPVALSLCIVLLLSGGGTVAAANSSMPSDPLYNVKLASEQVQLFFTFDNAGKANLYSEFVAERVNEIVSMAYANNVEAMDKSSRIMQNQLAMIYTLSQDTSLSATVPGAETLNGMSTVTMTETIRIDSEEMTTPDKHITLTQTTDTIRTSAVTVTKTVTAGGEANTVAGSFTTDTTGSAQFIGTPPLYFINTGNQLLVDTLYNNIMALYMATANNSGEVLESLLQAIAILENSYNIATGNAN